jgi:hypothetical protein
VICKKIRGFGEELEMGNNKYLESRLKTLEDFTAEIRKDVDVLNDSTMHYKETPATSFKAAARRFGQVFTVPKCYACPMMSPGEWAIIGSGESKVIKPSWVDNPLERLGVIKPQTPKHFDRNGTEIRVGDWVVAPKIGSHDLDGEVIVVRIDKIEDSKPFAILELSDDFFSRERDIILYKRGE